MYIIKYENIITHLSYTFNMHIRRNSEIAFTTHISRAHLAGRQAGTRCGQAGMHTHTREQQKQKNSDTQL